MRPGPHSGRRPQSRLWSSQYVQAWTVTSASFPFEGSLAWPQSPHHAGGSDCAGGDSRCP
jgi:hypothetical protein